MVTEDEMIIEVSSPKLDSTVLIKTVSSSAQKKLKKEEAKLHKKGRRFSLYDQKQPMAQNLDETLLLDTPIGIVSDPDR